MNRQTDIQIQGAEVEIFYSIRDGEIKSCSVKIDGHKHEANWILDIPAVYEDLLSHNANLLLEDNA